MPGSAPPTPPREKERLQALWRYRVLDTKPEPLLQSVAQLASLICGTPMAVVTLIDEERQWFKARVGVEVPETPRNMAFCAYTILGRDLLIVNDAYSDDRFAQNPLVTSAPGIRFYAGTPLVTPDDYAIGTVAVMDRIPREFSTEQRRALKLLAQHVVDHFEARRLADESTEAFRAIVHACPLAIMALDVDGRVTLWNESAQLMFGYTEQEIVGRMTPIVPST